MMIKRWLWIIALGLSYAMSAGAFQFRLQGDRLSLKADHTPMNDILLAFARSGVKVQVDPGLDATVTGRLTNEDVEKALGTLLESYGYVLLWDVIDGPLGPFPKLAEIRVFQPGQEEKVRPLAGVSDNLEVITGPSGRGPAFVKDEILIGVKEGTRLDDFKLLLDQIGGVLINGIPELGIYQVRLPPGTNIPDLVAQLSRNPMMAVVEPNYVTRVPAPQAVGSSVATASAGAASLDAPAKGAASVAILDSGLLASAGLDDVVVGRYDALNPDRDLGDAVGHGTQMAMIAAGAVQPDGEKGESGAVPVVAIRAFDDNGNASYFSLMRSIDYAVQQKAKVINLSWGSDTDSEFLKSAIGYAQKKGLIVVAAAGNDPTGKAVYPAAYPGVVAVSALDGENAVWEKSNYGDFVALAAPGTANFSVGNKGPAGAYAGTSIASAYTARALALYLTQHPKATRQEALAALKQSLTDRGTAGKDNYYGYGALDAAAMARLLTP